MDRRYANLGHGSRSSRRRGTLIPKELAQRVRRYLSSFQGQHQASAPTDEAPLTPVAPVPHPRGRRSTWLFALLIPVCAGGPWFVPWPWQHSAEGAPSNDPSAIIVLAHSQAVTGRAKTTRVPAPSAASVKDLTATARAGYDMPVSAAAVAKVKTTPGPYQKLGRVAIPRIGLNVSFGEGVYAAALDHGPGHWPGTVLPGQEGNSVLSGHRNTHTAPFKYLNLLRHGDKIVITVKGRKPVTFQVKKTTIVREAKFKDFVLQQPSDPSSRTVTLFACHPEGNPIFRIVVRADLDG